MISEIANFRAFREKLSYYLNKALNGENIAIKSKDRELILMSMEEYKELVIDETEYLLSTEPNKSHLEESLADSKEGNVVKVDLDELWK